MGMPTFLRQRLGSFVNGKGVVVADTMAVSGPMSPVLFSCQGKFDQEVYISSRGILSIYAYALSPMCQAALVASTILATSVRIGLILLLHSE